MATLEGLNGLVEVAANAQAASRDPLDAYFDTVKEKLKDTTVVLERRTRTLYRAEFDEVAFATLEKTLAATKTVAKQQDMNADVLITAEKVKIVVILKASENKQPTQITGKKHGLDDQTGGTERPEDCNTREPLASTAQDSKVDTVVDDKVLDLIRQLGKSTHYKKEAVDSAELLLRSAGRLKGVSGERALQSFSAAFRKLGSQAHALIVAVSFNSGVCIRLTSLKRACGRAWNDGQLAIGKLNNFDDVKPPLSEEGQAALLFGNHPLMLLTSMG